jgi:prevent-host-death family protein
MIVNIHAAKTNLSRLLDRAVAGDEVIIAKAGKPMARLVPYERPQQPRQPGRLRGRITIADDFDHTPDWLIDEFEGRRGGR